MFIVTYLFKRKYMFMFKYLSIVTYQLSIQNLLYEVIIVR